MKPNVEANSSSSPLEIRGRLSHHAMCTVKRRKGQWHLAFTCTQILLVLKSEREKMIQMPEMCFPSCICRINAILALNKPYRSHLFTGEVLLKRFMIDYAG